MLQRVRRILARFAVGLSASLATCLALPCSAQPFPQHAVRVLVPFPAGGTTDAMARIVAEPLAQRWGQPVTVENLTGANGIVAAEALSRAVPDGHVLMATPPGPILLNTYLYRNLPYAPRNFQPLAVLASLPTVLAVRKDLTARDPGELLALLRADPDRYTYASQGIGSTSHLTGALLESSAGVRLRHIPFNGSAPALTALAGSQIDLFFDNLSSSLPLHRAGRIRIIASADRTRVPLLPDLPALQEAGLPGFESNTVNLLVAPAGIAPGLARRLSTDAQAVLALPEVQARLAPLGVTRSGGGMDEAGRVLSEQGVRWQKVIQDARISLER